MGEGDQKVAVAKPLSFVVEKNASVPQRVQSARERPVAVITSPFSEFSMEELHHIEKQWAQIAPRNNTTIGERDK